MSNILLLDSATESIDALSKILSKFGIRFLIDIVSCFVLIQFIYIKYHKNKDLVFTYFIFNVVIFIISFLLNRVEISMGAAFGLFAVFSMLRYKTEELSIKDMTYLFLNIAIGIVSAVTKVKGADELYECVFILSIVGCMLLVTGLMESNLLMKQEVYKVIFYERIELITPDKTEELLADLRQRTGFPIHRADIQKIDFLRDSTQIKVYYYEN